MKIEVKTRKNGTRRLIYHTTGKSMTKQSMKKDCDINNILKKYEATGKLPDMIKKDARYGDFSNVNDYQTSMNIVIKAKEQFDNLPSSVRHRFNNDPAQFLEFANNPENNDQLKKMGLLNEKENGNNDKNLTPEEDKKSTSESVEDEADNIGITENE